MVGELEQVRYLDHGDKRVIDRAWAMRMCFGKPWPTVADVHGLRRAGAPAAVSTPVLEPHQLQAGPERSPAPSPGRSGAAKRRAELTADLGTDLVVVGNGVVLAVESAPVRNVETVAIQNTRDAANEDWFAALKSRHGK